MEQKPAVKFRNQHFDSSLKNGLCASFTEQEFCDVTFAVGNHLYNAHKIVLSLSSLYLKNILLSSPTKYPIVVLSDVRPEILEHLLQFMYCGSVEVPEADMEEFISSGRNLRIIGLHDPNVLIPNANKSTEDLYTNSSLTYNPERLEHYEVQKSPERKRGVDLASTKKAKKRRVSFKIEPDVIKDNNEQMLYSHIMEPEVRIQDDFPQMEDFDDASFKRNYTSQFTKSAGNIEDADIKFVKGVSGKLHLVCNNYTFHKNSMRRDRVYWLCAAYQSSLQCRARCLTIDGKVVSITGCHNHETDYKERLSANVDISTAMENSSNVEDTTLSEIPSTSPCASVPESTLTPESTSAPESTSVPETSSAPETTSIPVSTSTTEIKTPREGNSISKNNLSLKSISQLKSSNTKNNTQKGGSTPKSSSTLKISSSKNISSTKCSSSVESASPSRNTCMSAKNTSPTKKNLSPKTSTPVANTSSQNNVTSQQNNLTQESHSVAENSIFTENCNITTDNVFPEQFLEQFMEEHLVKPSQ